jgi:hypothetical protein
MAITQLEHDIYNAARYIIDNWSTIGAYSLGGVSLATIAHKVERGRGNLSLQKLGYTIVGLGSLAAVLAQFALHAHSAGANWHVIPQNLGFLAGPALFLHKFVVSDGFEALAEKLGKFSEALQAIEAQEQQLEAAAQATQPAPTDNQFVG